MIRIVRQGNDVAVDEFGNIYEIKEDIRGVNEKFWIKKKDGQFKDSYLIKFSNKNPNKMIELNLYNEVICSQILAKLGLNHVVYDLCEFIDSNGTVKHGVISQNYKESASIIEMNGKSLHESFCDWYYDNNFGQIPNVPINTVFTYIEQLKTRFESQQMTMSPETENRLTEELLTLALFDFCICQIDRHWGNVGWVHNNIFADECFDIRLLPIYDNECSFLLDDVSEDDLMALLNNIRSQKKIQNAKDTVNKKRTNSPCLGIKTSLVRIKENSNGFLIPLSNIEENTSNAQIAARELAVEISNRPQIRKLYDKINDFNMDEFLNGLDFIPESQDYLKEIYSFVWNTRIGLLKDSMSKIKENKEGEMNYEAGLSQL